MPSISVGTFIVPSENTIKILNLLCMTLSSFTYYLFKNYILSDNNKKKQTTPPNTKWCLNRPELEIPFYTVP